MVVETWHDDRHGEELIRRFSELSNETAGEHFTPREVIRLMVNLLFVEDDDILSEPGAKATLSVRDLPVGHDAEGPERVELEVGNSLESYDPENPGDQHPNERFDDLFANPPFGVEWEEGRRPGPPRARVARFGSRGFLHVSGSTTDQ